MNREEWVILFRYIRSMYPQQRFDEYTPDAWYRVLSDYDAHAVEAAVTVCAGKKPFISPAEIIAAVRDASAERVGEFQYEPTDPDETPEQYIANYRQQLGEVVAGRRPPVLALPPGRSLGDVEDVVRKLPEDAEPARRPGPLGVECPRCRVPAGKNCRTTFRGRRMADVHPARLDASRSRT
jgi:hypothetical protein